MKRGDTNPYVDIRYSIVACNMSLLKVKLQLGLPYRNFWINWSLQWYKICLLIFLILFKRVCLGVRKLGLWRKKCVIVSISLTQSHNVFRVSWKQCLNLRSQRWLNSRLNLVRSLIPYGLWISKILFPQRLTKFRRFFIKIEGLLEFLIFYSSLFHSGIIEWNNEFLK